MKCPNCDKEGAYLRLKTNQIVCRWCGNIENIKQKNPKKNKPFNSVRSNKNKGKI